jgi:hypothetical protein
VKARNQTWLKWSAAGAFLWLICSFVRSSINSFEGNMLFFVIWYYGLDCTMKNFNHEDKCLLGCLAVYSGRSLPTFQRYLLPPSSGRSLAPLIKDSHLHACCRVNLKSRKVYSSYRHQFVFEFISKMVLLRLWKTSENENRQYEGKRVMRV